MNRQLWPKLTLTGIGKSIALASLIAGIGLTQSVLALNIDTTQLALSNVPNFCQESESTFVMAQTKDFWLNICGGDLPNTYVGVNKRTGAKIRLPLSSYSSDGLAFTARNGNVQYLITFKTAKGDVLVVLQGQREILRQFIY
jgi:hypothetical protein